MCLSAKLSNDLTTVDLLPGLSNGAFNGVEVQSTVDINSLVFQGDVNLFHAIQLVQHSVDSVGAAGARHGDIELVMGHRQIIVISSFWYRDQSKNR